MKPLSTRKLVLTAMLACLAFVLNTFVWFPAMAPFQHFVNALSAVFVGPWYGAAAGFLTGVMRMLCGRDIGSVVGAVFGPILAVCCTESSNLFGPYLWARSLAPA